ncbi:hypothetical protein HYFRA_00012247 [Hymenoscyphus fraxineus]|uniref:Uncharacterized protein n=1 Tax=Hymenoscyphus fraxineus TaxID=746836 RepID=A0A9N9L1S7_9HELO|nr:hypothetical protein HYFRA_00012247 [Hymenoscyphus fraxineus]
MSCEEHVPRMGQMQLASKSQLEPEVALHALSFQSLACPTSRSSRVKLLFMRFTKLKACHEVCKTLCVHSITTKYECTFKVAQVSCSEAAAEKKLLHLSHLCR